MVGVAGAVGETTPEIESSGIFLSPMVTAGTEPANDTDDASPVWLSPLESRYSTVWPTRLVAAMRICSAKFSVLVESMLVSFSIIASCVVWPIIWFVSIGELGSWLRSCVTSSCMNASPSRDCLGCRVGRVV